MPETLRGVDPDGLERSCIRGADSISFAPAAPGIERAEVFLRACRFEPHRHDRYAIGITTSGVQTFRYRGERRICLPGELHVVHPDETHDGAPGTGEGFGYRIVYLAPELVSAALGGRALPFVSPVHRPSPLTAPVAGLLASLDEPLDELARADLVTLVSDLLRALEEGEQPPRPIDGRAVEAVREYLAAHARERVSAAELEEVAGTDRFSIARQFRSAFGTSPDRFRTLRRLELARAAIEQGRPLLEAALEAGFADQSHLTRQFKRAYGLTPGRWMRLTAAGRATVGA